MLEEKKRNGFAIVGFVLSLIRVIMVSIEMTWIPLMNFMGGGSDIFMAISTSFIFFVIGLGAFTVTLLGGLLYWPTAILGVVFSSVGVAKARRGFGGKKLAIAGLILGIIAFISTVFGSIKFARELSASM